MSGADNPRGQNFDVNRNHLSLQSFVTSFKKKSQVWFYTFFFFFIILYMYIALGRGWQHPGDEILMSTGTSCHFSHLLQVQKKISFKSDFIHFFHDFIHVYSPGARADSPQGTKFWLQQKCLVTSFICCKFQKKCLWSPILNNFFMI